jgi:hypothetical protein
MFSPSSVGIYSSLLSYSSISLLPLPHSFYTCRCLLLDTYISSNPGQFWPRMFYRSGWLRCVGLKYVGNSCFMFQEFWCIGLCYSRYDVWSWIGIVRYIWILFVLLSWIVFILVCVLVCW